MIHKIVKIFIINYLNIKMGKPWFISFKSKIPFKQLLNIVKHKYSLIINNCSIGKDVIISDGIRLQNVEIIGKVKLGRYVSISGPATRISTRLDGINIGSFSSIASNVIIQEDYHRYDKVSTSFMIGHPLTSDTDGMEYFSKGQIVIEEDVWIGSNTVILSGVTIGRGSIIGAGSIVTKNIPKYSIVAGNPTKIIRQRFPDKIILELEKSEWWNWSVNKINEHKQDFLKDLTKGTDNVFTYSS